MTRPTDHVCKTCGANVNEPCVRTRGRLKGRLLPGGRTHDARDWRHFYADGFLDGRFLAQHLPNWVVSDLILRFERYSEHESPYREGTRVGLTTILDSRDSAWRTYAALRAGT